MSLDKGGMWVGSDWGGGTYKRLSDDEPGRENFSLTSTGTPHTHAHPLILLPRLDLVHYRSLHLMQALAIN